MTTVRLGYREAQLTTYEDFTRQLTVGCGGRQDLREVRNRKAPSDD